MKEGKTHTTNCFDTFIKTVGKVTIYPVGLEEHKKYAADNKLKHTSAMRSKRV